MENIEKTMNNTPIDQELLNEQLNDLTPKSKLNINLISNLFNKMKM